MRVRDWERDKYGTIWHLVVYVCKICRIHNKKIEIKLKSYMECYTAAHTHTHTHNQTKRNRSVDKDRASISENEIACVQMKEWERERKRDVCSISVDNLSPRRVYWFLVSIKKYCRMFLSFSCLLLYETSPRLFASCLFIHLSSFLSLIFALELPRCRMLFFTPRWRKKERERERERERWNLSVRQDWHQRERERWRWAGHEKKEIQSRKKNW